MTPTPDTLQAALAKPYGGHPEFGPRWMANQAHPSIAGWQALAEDALTAFEQCRAALRAALQGDADAPVGGMREAEWDEADGMCPNCITPWKCNGPHLSEQTVAGRRHAAARSSPAPAEGLDVERLRDAMFDADPGCSGIPGECCAPPTHANATEVAAEYARLTAARQGEPR